MATTEGTKPIEPVQVRDHLVEVLARDLVGAEPEEVLSVAPSRWYLTGFLVPHEAPAEVRQDPDPDEEVAGGGGGDDDDEGSPPEVASARKAFFPSSVGLSVLVPATTRALSVRATWGEYVREDGSVRPAPEGEGPESQAAARPQERWRRAPREAAETFAIPATGKETYPLANGVNVVLSVRYFRPRRTLTTLGFRKNCPSRSLTTSGFRKNCPSRSLTTLGFRKNCPSRSSTTSGFRSDHADLAFGDGI
jgi:hypothetical protein